MLRLETRAFWISWLCRCVTQGYYRVFWYCVIFRVRVLLKRTVVGDWAEVIFRVKWIVFVSRWCYNVGLLNVIGQFNHDGIKMLASSAALTWLISRVLPTWLLGRLDARDKRVEAVLISFVFYIMMRKEIQASVSVDWLPININDSNTISSGNKSVQESDLTIVFKFNSEGNFGIGF